MRNKSMIIKDLMKNLFQPENLDLAQELSRKHCHIHGLHSIVLNKNERGQLTRFYKTDKDHELTQGKLGIHNHRYDLNLWGVYGQAVNKIYIRDFYGSLYKKFIFFDREKIEKTNRAYFLSCVETKILSFGEYVRLRADDLHTIYAPECEEACWIVFEGETIRDCTHLYNFGDDPICTKHEKFTKKEIQEILETTLDKLEDKP